MPVEQIYSAMRAEILTDHALMHWLTIIVALAVLGGLWLVEVRPSLLAVFLPLLSTAWAASILRFDLFIHRQATYLRLIEESDRSSRLNVLSWDAWKSTLISTNVFVPVADLIACSVIVVPTLYLLFGSCQAQFVRLGWRAAKLYAWGVATVMCGSLVLLAAIPFIAGR